LLSQLSIERGATVGECRNCGAQATKDLGYIGVIAPFFLKRVLNLDFGLAPSRSPLKRFLRTIGFFSKDCQKIYGKSVLVEIEICTACSFIQTKQPFSDEAIGKLYTDYRSETYNRERISYEPEYEEIASQTGSCSQEIKARTGCLTRWLNGKINVQKSLSMLDYGGADGRFLPSLQGEKYVFDISDVEPAEGIKRIRDESSLSSYSYIQLAHVLEHVPHPLALTKKAASFLTRSGYLYVEVPLEVSDETLTRLANGDNTIAVDIHEHINRYSLKSVTELFRSAGLSLVAAETEEVDLGWNKPTIIRALGKKV
jgi:hypothetical protein